MHSSLSRLGYYEVGNKLILNKANALIESKSTNSPIRWIFNDDVYSKFDWRVGIQEDLSSLYRRRAQQLRDKYDHLILYYSGGADSTNVLHAFIDNGILLDEIVMQYPFVLESTFNNTDITNNNYFSEIKYAAAVHLDRVKSRLDPRTKIRYLDQCADTLELFSDQYWFEKFPLGTMITPAGSGRQISAILDSQLDQHYEQGRTVCQIYGVDKPLVVLERGEFYAYFRDANATHAVPSGYTLGEIASKYFNLEFFYWTPDLPEIVIKQAQIIKAAALQNTSRLMSCLQYNSSLEDIRQKIHPLIYCAEACLPTFQTVKPQGNVSRKMDKWFWDTANEDIKHNYLQVIKYLGSNINQAAFIDNNVENGLNAMMSRKYPL